MKFGTCVRYLMTAFLCASLFVWPACASEADFDEVQSVFDSVNSVLHPEWKRSGNPEQLEPAPPAPRPLALREAKALRKAGKLRNAGNRAVGDGEAIGLDELDCSIYDCDSLYVALDSDGNLLGLVDISAMTDGGTGFDRSRMITRRDQLSMLKGPSQKGQLGQFVQDFATGVDSLANPGKYDHGASEVVEQMDAEYRPAPAPSPSPSPDAERSAGKTQKSALKRDFAKDFATGVDSLANPGKYDHGASEVVEQMDAEYRPAPVPSPAPSPSPQPTFRGAVAEEDLCLEIAKAQVGSISWELGYSGETPDVEKICRNPAYGGTEGYCRRSVECAMDKACNKAIANATTAAEALAIMQFDKQFCTYAEELAAKILAEEGATRAVAKKNPAGLKRGLEETGLQENAPVAKPGGAAAIEPSQGGAEATRAISPKITNGRYYALVVGINDYRHINKLENAVNDARVVAEVLKSDYGFETTVLLEEQATRDSIMKAINDLRKRLAEDDSLLIYYSGHGEFNKDTGTSYWLPVDADHDDTTKWLEARSISDQLKLIAAKHILIVADSCFSGTMTRTADTSLRGKTTRENYLNKLFDKPSRVLIASGGNEPVSDSGAKDHSLFAAVFIDALKNPFDRVFTAEELMARHIKEPVAGRTEQTPEYRIIRNSGHDGGDFVFVQRAVARE